MHCAGMKKAELFFKVNFLKAHRYMEGTKLYFLEIQT